MSQTQTSSPSPSEAELSPEIQRDLDQIADWCEYHAPNPHQHLLLMEARDQVRALMTFLVVNLEPSRERSIALTELRTARMLVNQAIIFDRRHE